jgi:hypothetical protein
VTGHLSLDQYTWSIGHYQAIHEWHRNCQIGHSGCNQTLSGCEKLDAEDTLLPTRCVEFQLLGAHDPQTSSVSWKLRKTEGQRGKYIALSHRWVQETGEASTTTENYRCRIDNSSCSHTPRDHLRTRGKLSALFLDAGRFACHLGIPFVWIDSVCIIQDDKEDWVSESVKMADYYQRSWITLAATATSPTGGIFGHRNIANMPRITRLPYMDKGGDVDGHFYVQAAADASLTRNYKEGISGSELLGRGWVHQEWMLSRRIFAVTDSGLFLQCRSGLPQSLNGHTVRSQNDGGPHSDLAFRAGLGPELTSSSASILKGWEQVVKTYSRSKITKFEQDRLVALTGITIEFQRALDSRAAPRTRKSRHRHVCGLWTDWHRGLLWEQAGAANTVRVKGFPTWSWLSIAAQSQSNTNSGLGVQWADSSDRWYKESTSCTFGTPIPIPVQESDWSPRFGRARGYSPNVPYGNETRFNILPTKGSILSVLVGYNFDNPEDVNTAASMTLYHADLSHSSWKPVSLERGPGKVTGWASLEHPDYHVSQARSPTYRLFALVVSIIPEAPGGYGLGNLTGSHAVYHVLYLNKIRISGFRECYERVGVGRLFGNAIERLIQDTPKVDILLV